MKQSEAIRDCETAIADFQRAIERLKSTSHGAAQPLLDVFTACEARQLKELERLKQEATAVP